MIGEIRVITHPKRQGKDWVKEYHKVKVVKEIPLPPGNQALFRVEYEDGKFGNIWANQLQPVREDKPSAAQQDAIALEQLGRSPSDARK